MSPERRKKIGGKLVEEYYWAGKIVVYVDHLAVEDTFDNVCKELEAEHGRKSMETTREAKTGIKEAVSAIEDANVKYRNSDQKWADQRTSLFMERLYVVEDAMEQLVSFHEDLGCRFGEIKMKALALQQWQSEARAFLRAEVNCDCETGYLCSRCALLVE